MKTDIFFGFHTVCFSRCFKFIYFQFGLIFTTVSFLISPISVAVYISSNVLFLTPNYRQKRKKQKSTHLKSSRIVCLSAGKLQRFKTFRIFYTVQYIFYTVWLSTISPILLFAKLESNGTR